MKKWTITLIITLLLALLYGCGQQSTANTASENASGFIAALPGNYDSADTAIVISKNTQESTITFQNLVLGRRYTLYYDGATEFYDKYGLAVSLEQISRGQLVDVTFMKGRKRLNSMALNAGAFQFENLSNLEISGNKVMLQGEEYRFDDNLAFISETAISELMEISAVDKVTLVGQDHTIYSLIVEQGHGYLRLENESFFVGGWVELSQSMIYPIEEDMLLTVPVGTYQVTVSGKGCTGSEQVTINRGEETTLDVSQWQGEEMYGTIVFTVSPDNATIYIDGEKIDLSNPQELSYGIHQMIVIADGYETISRYLRVTSDYSNMDITMEAKTSEDSVSDNSVSENSVSDNTASGNSISENGTTAASAQPSGLLPIVSSAPSAAASASPSGQSSPMPSASPSAGQGERENGTTDNSTPSQTITTSNEHRVHIEAPESVEVYVNGSYIGLAPVSFTKTEGTYEITLRKSGYQTRSYTITIDATQTDISYSFSELLPMN
ncbi:MAG: PEGA domain-containing protein [Lachnospiraceae bacterium]